MDDELHEMREADQRAADLDHLGPAVGTGATIWARAAQDALALHVSARDRFEANATVPLDVWERFFASASMIVIAVNQVRAFARRVLSVTDDSELSSATARFDASTPDVKDFRDLVAHLDAYAIGRGWLQQPSTADGAPAPPRISERNIAPTPFWTSDSSEGVSSTYLDLAEMRVNLGRSVEAATELAQVVERVRARHEERAGNEAEAALWRHYERFKRSEADPENR